MQLAKLELAAAPLATLCRLNQLVLDAPGLAASGTVRAQKRMAGWTRVTL